MRDHKSSAPTAAAHETAAGGSVGKATLAMVPTEGGEQVDPSLVAKVKHAANEGHGGRALDLMASVPTDEQAQIAGALGAGSRAKLSQHVPHQVADDHPRKVAIRLLFDHTPDSEQNTLQRLFEGRFVIDVKNKPKELSPLGLRRLWQVWEALPALHVAHNWAASILHRYVDKQDPDPSHAHGAYSYPDGPGVIDLSYRDDIIRTGGTTDHDMEGDPLHGVNRFDEVARHEIGHAVDRELGLPSFNVLSKTKEAGHWDEVWDKAGYRRMAEDMVKRSNGAIHKLHGANRERVLDAMVATMNQSSADHFNHVIAHMEVNGLRQDPIYRIMNHGLADQNPWLSTLAIGGRHFHQAYEGDSKRGGAGAIWVSYEQAAWQGHRVSEYQFRAIPEWFAECYAAYYTPGDIGQPKGVRLKDRLPHTYEWFKAHVDNAKNARRAAGRARRDEHAPTK